MRELFGEPSARLRVRAYPSAYVMEVRGPLDLKTAPVLDRVLSALIETASVLVVDLTEATLVDAQNAGILTATARRAAAAGRRLRVHGAQGRVLRLLEIVGVDKELGVHDEAPLPCEGGEDRTVETLLRGRLGAADPVRAELRTLAIESAQTLAYGMARRYRGHGEPAEDLNQVALLGLVKAVDRFEPERGSAFAAFAVPTIIGELKRHFRDRGWQIRVPRKVQEIRLQIASATQELLQRLGRSPTVAELSGYLEVPEEEILEAYEAAQAYRPDSLSTPVGFDSDESLADRIGGEDPEYDLIDFRASVGPLLAGLPARQQRVLSLRFYGNLTQTEIAAQIGVSQMQVSRLLSAALRRLRQDLSG